MTYLSNWNNSDVILVTHHFVRDEQFDVNSSWSTMFYNWTNSSSTTSSVAADNFWLDNRCNSFEFFFNTVLIGVLCLFGIATNILAIVVLGKDRHNRVATFLLRSLSVADTAVLAITFVVMSVFFGTSKIPGVVEGYTGFLIPYLKKVYCRPTSSRVGKVLNSNSSLMPMQLYFAKCKRFSVAEIRIFSCSINF